MQTVALPGAGPDAVTLTSADMPGLCGIIELRHAAPHA